MHIVRSLKQMYNKLQKLYADINCKAGKLRVIINTELTGPRRSVASAHSVCCVHDSTSLSKYAPLFVNETIQLSFHIITVSTDRFFFFKFSIYSADLCHQFEGRFPHDLIKSSCN